MSPKYWSQENRQILKINEKYRNLNGMDTGSEIKTLQKEQLESALLALRQQLNPHHLANSMQLLQYFIYNDEKEKAAEYISKYCSYMRQLFENSSIGFITLLNETVFLKSYIELESMRINGGISLELSYNGISRAQNFLIPGMILQPFVEFTFAHVLKNCTSTKNSPILLKIILTLQSNTTILCHILCNGNPLTDKDILNIIQDSTIRSVAEQKLKMFSQIFNTELPYKILSNKETTTIEILIPYKEMHNE